MHVLATAGHVDHGKSTLVKALTGMEPDRWAEERRRGLTIDLGFAWTTLPSGATAAFVDVPGHERFVPNMLAGVGPVPAALFVVAADEGWMPQSAEHLDALHALGVQHAVVAVTRSDLADPGPAAQRAREEMESTSLGDVDVVSVSGIDGTGLEALRRSLDRLVATLPAPDTDDAVRLWVDRSFSITGSGTVVTGTLPAGRLRVGDELEIAALGRTARVRGLHCLAEPVAEATAVARVALNLRGVSTDDVRRGDALLTPGRFRPTDMVDVRVHGDEVTSLPRQVMMHTGSAAIPARVRPLGADTARLTLARPVPLRIGDHGLLRDPGSHRIAGGLTVLDVAPPALRRRGAAAARAKALTDLDGRPDEGSELRRRGFARREDLERMGVQVTGTPVGAGWLVDDDLWGRLRTRLRETVAEARRRNPLEPGPPIEVVRRALGLPDRALVHALVAAPLEVRSGRVVTAEDDGAAGQLPTRLIEAIETLRADLADQPFAAPDASRLAELGLGRRELAAAERAGAVVRLADGVVLLPGCVREATRRLRALPQPFTVSEARKTLGTTRRVAVPLLEYLDRQAVTRRLPDDRRTVRMSSADVGMAR
ncbi:selenocysteine-specific translation elongation factor [Phytoactinopolyspora halotolerans]|uniref:Selenocysteine-specific elongation factor n=1 Tax=Phytoactinopolyspora halotolerans TaxID=1981512 RepID=A0A6L9SAI7_9ACTN|nr:selenocysteine-specific translation elongation factor [Phytoactinopolyspora halotolerans]NEE02053.1 selenocysteine-specific translation elongation factor [Phytoactinopolyspora halotolerans]